MTSFGSQFTYASGLRSNSGNPALEVAQGRFQFRKTKLKTRFNEPARHYSPTLDDQLGLGSEKESAQFEHPAAGGQPDPYTAHPAQGAHHFPVWNRTRRGEVDRPVEIVPA